jgi:hypothetical protein
MEIKFPLPVPPSTCSARILFFSLPFAFTVFYFVFFGPYFLVYTFFPFHFPISSCFLFSFLSMYRCLCCKCHCPGLLAGSAGPWFPSLVLPWFPKSRNLEALSLLMSTCFCLPPTSLLSIPSRPLNPLVLLAMSYCFQFLKWTVFLRGLAWMYVVVCSVG